MPKISQSVSAAYALAGFWHEPCDAAAMAERDTQRNDEDRLERRAQELESLREAEHESGFGGDQRELTGELSTLDQHPADTADFTYQRELQLTTQQILEREAQQVQDALQRRAEGKYGVCENCGGQIAPARLEARPEATLCIECQRQQEEGNR